MLRVSNYFFMAAFIVLCVVGCHSQQADDFDHLTQNGSYECTAVDSVSGVVHGTGYSTHYRQAQTRAIAACQKVAKEDSHIQCEVSRCRWKEVTPAQQRYKPYYCYARNHVVNGVWRGVSINRQEAKQAALKSCHKSSGRPEACYQGYCELVS